MARSGEGILRNVEPVVAAHEPKNKKNGQERREAPKQDGEGAEKVFNKGKNAPF